MLRTGSGRVGHNARFKARNRHLVPEVTQRAERVLEQVVEEEAAALDVYPSLGEYWHRKINGPQCTCRREKEEETGEELFDLTKFIQGTAMNLIDDAFCPLCFGTGFVGGYYKHGTVNIVLEGSQEPRAHRVQLVKESPYYYKPTNKRGTVTWKVQIPARFSSVGDVAIRWKEAPAQWSLTIDGEPFTKDLLAIHAGDIVDITLIMKDSSNEDAGFYGLFMQFIVKSEGLIPLDIPLSVKKSTGVASEETESSVSINFGSITNSRSADTVVDHEGFVWRLIEVAENKPMDKTISVTAQARLVRQFEVYYLLPSRRINSSYKTDTYMFIA